MEEEEKAFVIAAIDLKIENDKKEKKKRNMQQKRREGD